MQAFAETRWDFKNAFIPDYVKHLPGTINQYVAAMASAKMILNLGAQPRTGIWKEVELNDYRFSKGKTHGSELPRSAAGAIKPY